jgi:DNA repair exonuclease SbcCD ATPase subunit
MSEEKKDEFQEKIDEISSQMDKLTDMLEVSGVFGDGILHPNDEMELPKKKKEREAFLKQKAKERFPILVKNVQELDVALQGLGFFIDEAKGRLEDKQEALEDIEQMKEDIEQRKSELDF